MRCVVASEVAALAFLSQGLRLFRHEKIVYKTTFIHDLSVR